MEFVQEKQLLDSHRAQVEVPVFSFQFYDVAQLAIDLFSHI
jgi:hypothetical protein